MSCNREQTNDSNEPSQSEDRKVQITEEFVRKLIKRGLLTCQEGTRREENNISDRDFMEKLGKLYARYEGECSGVKEYLYSIATTEDLRRRADKLCGIIDEALDVAKNFFSWNKYTLGDCYIKFYDLKSKWFSATEGFFSQVKQDLATMPAETEPGTAPEKEKEKAKTIGIVNIQNFKGILGDVQAENIQTGDYASIHKHPQVEKKSKASGKVRRLFKKIIGWLLKKTWYLIGAIIVAIIVTILIDIFRDFGWLD